LNLLTPVKTLTLLLLILLPAGLLAGRSNSVVSNPVANPTRLEVWSPDVHSSNITNLAFTPDTQFSVRVNITNAGPLLGFDVTLLYNITAGPNVLQAVHPQTDPLAGGLFDPNGVYPSGCGIVTVKDNVDIPAGSIRFAAVVQGGCPVPGTGTLFSITFQVVGTGATSIDIAQVPTQGRPGSTIVGGVGTPPVSTVVPYLPFNAYFRNKPGIPPIPTFTFTPTQPLIGDSVQFDASQSIDPDNLTLPGSGIARYNWDFGDFISNQVGAGVKVSHVFSLIFNQPAAGIFAVRLVVWDFDDQLPAESIVVINVSNGFTSIISTNWSGYAVRGTPGSVSDVKGSWVVPGIVGTCPSTDAHSSFWVGIDGLNSPTVEQTGTESACINGSPAYFAWYELFPRPSVKINTITLHPGDVVTAEVQFSNNKFNVSITDVTTGTSFSRSIHVNGAARSSAEWIAEAPSSRAGQLPLANFGTVMFGQDYTGVLGTCSATIGSVSSPLGTFAATGVVISMAKPSLIFLARPTPVSRDKTSFTVIWTNS